MIDDVPLPELAKAYVETICGPANGFGQHVHPRFGRSDHIMFMMRLNFGTDNTNKAIDAAFHDRKLRYAGRSEQRA